MAVNPLSQITLDAEYTSGPLATSDLHAGGIFFCVLYEEVLIFRPNNVVELDVRILDNWRPLDDEADFLSKRSATCSYGLNDREYLSCKFPHATYTGLPCDLNPDWLAFHLTYRYFDQCNSRVYTLRTGKQ